MWRNSEPLTRVQLHRQTLCSCQNQHYLCLPLCHCLHLLNSCPQLLSTAEEIPERINPFTINCGLLVMCSKSHFVETSFKIGIPRLISVLSEWSVFFPSSCCITCSEYQSSNFCFRYSFAGLLTEMSIGWSLSVLFGGSQEMGMLFSSKWSVIFVVVCPLKN